MANRTQVIDPNNVLGVVSTYNNVPVPLEDLTISVQLSVDKKNRTLLTTDKEGSYIETEKGVSIKFIEGSQIGRNKHLTTKYTDLTTRPGDENVDEALGITSVDITFNSSYAPMIVIQFVDVRGSAIFQNEDRISKGNNKYSVFFQLPYPLYKLSIKGYYGQQVEYCLHMTKMNSRFNSQTGNFEITAEFVGYTYAMLSDALIGFMRAIAYTKEGSNKYKELNVMTLDELYEKISKINEKVKGILSTSPQASNVNTGTKKLEELDTIKNIIGVLNTFSLNNIAAKEPVGNDYSITIYKTDNYDSVKEEITNYSNNIGKAVDDYNLNTNFALKREDFTDIGNNVKRKFGEINQNKGDDLNKAVLNYLAKNEITIGDEVSLTIIDNRARLAKLSEVIVATKGDIDLLKQDLAKQLDTEVTSNLGFSPSVRNITNILVTAVEVLFYVIHEVSRAAETKQPRKDALKKIFKRPLQTDIKQDAIGQTPNNSASGALSDVFYPWPAYRKYNDADGYEETYLGEAYEVTDTEKSDVTELVFIDKLLEAFLTSNKKINEIQKNLAQNLVNWFAINPLDTRLFVNTEPYARYNSLSPEDLIRIIMLRAITFIGVSNKELAPEEIIKMAEAEYEAIVNTPLKNKNVVQSLTGKKLEDYINITGTYKASESDTSTPKKLLVLDSSNYKYDFISFNVSGNEAGRIIPISNGFNGGVWPNNLSELVGKRNENSIFITNYDSSTPSSNPSKQKPDDGGVYIKIFDKEAYAEFSTASLPQSVDIKPLSYVNLKDANKKYSEIGFNVFGSAYGVQSFDLLDYEETSNITGAVEQIKNFSYRYIFYAHDSSLAKDGDRIIANGLGYTRKDSGSNGVPSKIYYDLYDWSNGGWVEKKQFYVLDATSPFEFKTNVYTSYGKNLILAYESTNSKPVTYPFIDFCVINEDNGRQAVPISLFGSRLYYEQTDENAKALLFLHTFPWKGLVGEDSETGKSIFDIPEIIRSFNERAGFVSVPKLWVYFIGGMLWRAKQNTDPIKFYKTDSNGIIIESFLPTFTSNDPSTYPKVNQYLLYQDPFVIKKKVQFGMIFREETDGDYKNLDKALLNLPEQVKFEFISSFEQFVQNNWLDIKSKLEVFDGNGASWVNKYNTIITNVSVSSNKFVLPTSVIKNNYKNFDNYIVFSPYYKQSNNPYKDTFWLALKDEATINQELVNLYKDEMIIANSTYRIWNNNPQDSQIRSDFFVKKQDLDTYITTIVNKFSGATGMVAADEEQQIKQSVFGTTSDKLIKLQLYKICKNIYDKWIGNVKNANSIFFQCESTNTSNEQRKLIDSFRFLTRSFEDIGDVLAVNPFPLMDYFSDNVNSSSYDLITNLLSSNNFNFIPLPNFINYRDDDSVKSIFKTYPTYGDFGASTYGPTFVCTYVGEASNSLDFNNSYFPNDGFDLKEDLLDAPQDFNSPLGENDLPVTAFKVVYGQQNQNIFKDIVLDQSEFSETAESLQIMEDISQKGNPKYRTIGGQNMYNIWSVRSYKAEIEMMGNAMIQPMMYFQLDNIPMFHGAYMIIKVAHSIKPNYMSTNFTGVRIKRPKTKLFSVNDFYMSLLENLEQLNETTGTDFGNQTISGSFPPIVATLIDTGAFNGYFQNVQVEGNKLVKIEKLPTGIRFSTDLSDSKRYLIPQAASALNKMLTDWVVWMKSQGGFADSNGTYAEITSMFRTYQDQKELYDSYKGVGVATPGKSNHGWGISLDFQFHEKNGKTIENRIGGAPNVKEGFDYTINQSLKWLVDNSYVYGFILPYELRSGGKNDEFWHFEYHGTSAKCLLSKNTKFRGPNGVNDGITVDVTKAYDATVKNPLGLDGNAVTYNDKDCSYKVINKTDGTGNATSSAYPDVLPDNNLITMSNNLTGDWVARARTLIITVETGGRFIAKPYKDTGYESKWRGGYGTDNIVLVAGNSPVPVTPTTVFTKQTSDLSLDYDINNRFKTAIISVLGQVNWDKLNSNQKAALMSYSYNAGAGTLKDRGIVDAITNNDYKKASKAIFEGPITSAGKVEKGLIKRRKIESIIFDKPV